MKPFHEIEPIPYEEFLDIVQKNTGLTSWRAKISRAGFGVIPTRESRNVLTVSNLKIGKKMKKVDLETVPNLVHVTNIINRIPIEISPPLRAVRSTGYWRNPWGSKIESQLGWGVTLQGDPISDLTIQYIFRKGIDGSEGPEQENDYYELGQEECLGWIFEMHNIVRNKRGEIINFDYTSGLSLRPLFKTYAEDVYHGWSKSPEILKEVFQYGFFSEFMNWNEGNPLEVKTMNREKFEKMVRPYLTSTKYPNKSLVEEKFEKQQSNYISGSHYISEKNKLLFIPTYGKAKGVFVFSDESDRYCYNSSFPASLDGWATYWSDDHNWIHLREPISDMNGGSGVVRREILFYFRIPTSI